MAALKTQPNDRSVAAFLDAIEDPVKQADCRKLADIMERITGSKAVMWGDAIIGFGSYHYTYESGREGDWFEVGFSPRKQSLTLYIMDGFADYSKLLGKLGKHSTGKSCLYIKRLSDIDEQVLESLIAESVAAVGARFP